MGWWKGEVGMGDIRLVERIWRWRPKEGIQVPIGSHLLVPRPNTNHKESRRAAVKLPLLSVHPEITRDVKVIVNSDDKAQRGSSAETAASSRGGGGGRGRRALPRRRRRQNHRREWHHRRLAVRTGDVDVDSHGKTRAGAAAGEGRSSAVDFPASLQGDKVPARSASTAFARPRGSSKSGGSALVELIMPRGSKDAHSAAECSGVGGGRVEGGGGGEAVRG